MMEMVRLISTMDGPQLIPVLRLNIHSRLRSISDVDHSPDGKFVLSGDDSGYLRVRNATTGALIASIQAFGDPTTQVAWSNDGRFVAFRPMLRTPSKCTMRVTSHKYMEISLQM